MAEGLAGKLFKGKLQFESAGISTAFEGAQPEAVEVMQDLYGIDISAHTTQEVTEDLLRRFDGVIVLDTYVYNVLKTQFSLWVDRFYLWDIDDPYGRPKKAYERTVKLIAYCIDKFMGLTKISKEST